jgi:hypothetical protein
VASSDERSNTSINIGVLLTLSSELLTFISVTLETRLQRWQECVAAKGSNAKDRLVVVVVRLVCRSNALGCNDTGWYATLLTAAAWPVNVWRVFPVAMSQSRSVLSEDAERMESPSGDHAAHSTVDLCPRYTCPVRRRASALSHFSSRWSFCIEKKDGRKGSGTNERKERKKEGRKKGEKKEGRKEGRRKKKRKEGGKEGRNEESEIDR